ncbi:hypothetical protein COX73_00060 [bacterium (Candidatus Gribaldobacteria) CG_4_10_14_0_2_um_filter_36_18]|uniref:Uncharacterized protein n=1 Tax=bacterium (Candidatus Gribaldobacteria) CG_4_10_14_0_2_um_filter_36_18 TaxID=2014264 RepID=A0A2M7VL96_9BACT|nr:MAG: hypothetical protein COX73_00060 [bacterium (Candidatus Gribaldobacteria) CG_4_10_14_0_2_um_filter_36_18]
MVEDKNKEIIKRLNVITGLLIDLVDLLSKKYEIEIPEKFRMARMKKLGLENEEIALLFGKSKKQVSKQVYETKRVKKPKSQKE